MTPKRWPEVRHLFEQAAELTQTDREALLARSCADDPTLRHEVETLLRLDATPDLDETRTARIGAYRLEGKIGSGGMSDVYLARRDDGSYRQQVAVKLLRQATRDDVAITRFRAERQILANLDHPNIARLLDGGTTPGGLPYLVIEYIDGLALDQYCDLHRLSIDARLQLLVHILDAVQFAHQNLVVHRDLKPSNILVTEDGTPKLLDFGIAKMIGPRVRPHLTQTGHRLMTPSYASPEQIRGQPITTATDVYALGVMLYEQLTSSSPYPQADAEAWPEVIFSTQPRPPSRVVVRPRRGSASQDETHAIPSAAEARSTTPALLRRRLRGDLDVIVLKALRKEPKRRYASAADLSLDLRRHLRQLPITARPDTLPYRWGKFARRNRVAVALSSSFFLLTLTLTAGFFGRLSEQVSRTTQERDRAQHVASFLVELFRLSQPEGPMVSTITARDLLDQGAERMAIEVRDQPLVQATLLDTMGQIYHQLGMSEKAASMLEQARTIWRRTGVDHQPELGRTLHHLAVVAEDAGDLDQARDLLEQSLAIVRESQGPRHLDTAGVLLSLANLERRQAAFDRAESLTRQALELLRGTLPPNDPRLADALFQLARLQLDLDQAQPAERNLHQALKIQTQASGKKHPKVATVLGALGLLAYNQNRIDEAIDYQERALDIHQEVLGTGAHPELAEAFNVLGGFYAERGNFSRAVPMLRESVEMQRRLHPSPSPGLVDSLGSLGLVLLNHGDLDAARDALIETHSMSRAIFGGDHPSTANNAQKLARLHHRRGEHRAAIALYKQSAATAERHLPPGHHYAAIPLLGWSAVLLDMNAGARAETKARQALAIFEARLPKNHRLVAEAQSTLGAALVSRGQYTEAEPLLVHGLTTLEKLPSDANRSLSITRARTALAALYEATG